VFDVIVDLRAGSRTGVDGSESSSRPTIGARCGAEGFRPRVHHVGRRQRVLYMMSVPHAPGSARGVRWNDPGIAIDWPLQPEHMSDRDAAYPLLDASITP